MTTERKQNRITINIKSEKLYKKIMAYKCEEKINFSEVFCKTLKSMMSKKSS